jgi:hypothetical protein
MTFGVAEQRIRGRPFNNVALYVWHRTELLPRLR